MYLKIREKLIVAVVFVILFGVHFDLMTAYGDNIIKIEDGALTFITNDTKATSGTKWKTAGFTITDKPCLGDDGNGGYPTKYNHATITIDQKDIESTDMGDGTIKSKFYLPESELSKILVDAGFADTIEEGGILYLNGIFQVTENGVNKGSLIDDFNSIKNARPWKNPNDFYDRFDIKVVYRGKKYNVETQYQLEDGTIVSNKISGAYKVGNVFNVALDKTITYKNNKYELITSYYVRNHSSGKWVSCKMIDFGYALNDIAAVSGKMPINGVKVYAIYRKTDGDVFDEEVYNINLGTTSVSEARIDSNYYGNELFEAQNRIPSGENLYVYANVPRYICEASLKRNRKSILQKVEVTAPYLLKWKEKVKKDGKEMYIDKEKEIVKKQVVTIETMVSYWTVDSIYLLKAEELSVNNELLDNDNISIDVSNIKEIGDNTIDCFEKTSDYITYDSTVKKVKLNTMVINGTDAEPDIPTFNYLAVAKEHIGEIYVANDKLVIGRKVILDNEKQINETLLPESYKDIANQRSIAYKTDFKIDDLKKNGKYKSEAYMQYKTVLSHNVEPVNKSIELKLNSVNVHTPVVCDGKVSTNVESSQLIDIDTTKPILVLDSYFMVGINAKGTHVKSKGYGYKDYSKYVKGYYVEFPFDVSINGEKIKKGTKYSISNGKTKIYMPTYIDTGKYQIKFYVKASNCDDNVKVYQNTANTNQERYCAIDKVDVEVSGRVFNFNIYDISDYPLWEKVFRNEKGGINGTRYRSGRYNYWGTTVVKDEIYTLPLRNGSHPYIKNKGSQKTGYTYKMYVDTMGDFDEKDYVWIVPKFYYVSNDGKTRKEVDLYYTETITIDGKSKKYHFVKVGSKIDKKNIKYYKQEKIFTYGNIMIPGSLSSEGVSNSKEYKRWFFQYYLPSQIYMVEKDVDVNREEYFGIDSDYIYRDGYLVINFDIEVIKDGERYLSYENKINSSLYNCCNMWKEEGMPLSITDNKGTVYNISYGDIMFINNNANAGKDYLAGGTH